MGQTIATYIHRVFDANSDILLSFKDEQAVTTGHRDADVRYSPIRSAT